MRRFNFSLIFGRILGGILLVAGLSLGNAAQAATLYLTPAAKSVAVGKTVSLAVIVNAGGQAINSAEATISFPSNRLEVVSISKGGSVFPIWVEEPTFSNSRGVISFSGGVPTPGFSGSSGRVISFVFKVKSPGEANIVFSSSAVRANDGLGTNVITGAGSAKLTGTGQAEPVASEPVNKPKIEDDSESSTELTANESVPAAPRIISPTNPDSNQWSASKDAKMTWKLPTGVNGVRLLVSQSPQSSPSILYSPAIDQKTLTNLDNGQWYFHVQLRNENGWGGIAHFGFKIDAERPEYFNIKLADQTDPTSPISRLVFDASDKVSGIDHYEVSIDHQDGKIWQDDGLHVFTTPSLTSGKHLLIAKAFDKAGNYLTSIFEFTIEPLKTPEIVGCPSELASQSTLTINGQTYPDSEVTIWIQKNNESADSVIVKSASNGVFSYTLDHKVDDGVYHVWAQVKNSQGAQSELSRKINIAVKQSPIMATGSQIINILSVMVIGCALIALLILIILYSWHKFLVLKRRLRQEARMTENTIHLTFSRLREEVGEQIKLLERTKNKRELTREEDRIIKQLKRHLNEAERALSEDIDIVEREIK